MRKTSIIHKWEKYFNSIGLPDDLAQSYIIYARKLLSNNTPPIFEFQHLARLLGRTNGYLASVIKSTQSHYRVFEIPKKRGGMRSIRAPYPALLECQRWILSNILSKVKIFKTAHGFAPNKSIKSNAKLHLGSDYVLKLDLKDFFDHINQKRVIGIFRRLGYAHNVSYYLSSLCCLEAATPQGAATSPTISNIVSYKMDKRLFGLARSSFELKYTRYADDMVFSGKYISKNFIRIVEDIINEEGFLLNSDKTRLYKGKQRKIITGISISNGVLAVPKAFKRCLRQELHFIKKYGLHSHIHNNRITNPFYANVIYGKLLFWNWIEPENNYVKHNMPIIKELTMQFIGYNETPI